MSNLKLILLGVGVIALLAGALVALKLTDDGDDGDTSSEPSDTIVSLWTGEEREVAKVEINGPSGEFVVTKLPNADEIEQLNQSFTIEAYKDYPLQKPMIYTIATNLCTVDSASVIEKDCASVDKYGLGDDKAIKVTLTTDSGAVRKFRIGDLNPTDESVSYFCLEGENTVYAVDSNKCANFRMKPEKFIATTVLEPLADGDTTAIDSLLIERKDMEYGHILYNKVVKDESTYGALAPLLMAEPIYAFLDLSKSTEIINGFFGLSADAVMLLGPNEDQLELAGVGKDPFCCVTMKCDDGNSYVLRLSNKMDVDTGDGTQSVYIGYFEGINILYYFMPSSVPWAYCAPMDITSTMILGTYFYDLGEMTVEGDGKILAFEGSGDSDKYTATLNGASIDSEIFRGLYSFILKAPADEMCLEEPKGELLCSVRVKTQSGKTEETLDFYELEGTRKVAISHNGKPSFKCRRTYLDRLLSNIGLVLSGEEIVQSW